MKSKIENTNPIAQLPAFVPDHDNAVYMVVESQQQCRNKYKFNPQNGLFELHKILPLGMFFPFDFGFIPSTMGQDGDPIDLIALMDEPTFTGCVAKIRLLGVIKARQREANSTTWIENHRLVGVSTVTHSYRNLESIEQIEPSILFEIEHFFVSYNAAQKREFKVDGRASVAESIALVKASAQQVEALV